MAWRKQRVPGFRVRPVTVGKVVSWKVAALSSITGWDIPAMTQRHAYK
jgi:hypothetical protein